MNLYEYQKSRSFIDLHPRSLRFIFSNSFLIFIYSFLIFIFFSLETSKPNFLWSLHGYGNDSTFKWCMSHGKYVVMPIYGKNLKKAFFSRTKRPITLKVSMLHRVLKYFQVCSNDDPELTLTYFTARSNLIPYAFVWEKDKIMDFSETIVVYDIKIGRFSLLNEYMNHYEYQRSRSFTELRPRSLRFNNSNSIFFCSETTRPIEIKFHMEPPWDVGDENLFKCSRSHDNAHFN